MLTQLFKPDKDYTLASALFLRVLALIYFAAFSSMAVQIIGLAGREGILPLQPLLDYRLANEGVAAYWHMPHLFWLGSSDLALKSVAIAGSVLSLLVLFGRYQKLIFILLFVLYLSLYYAGQIFMNFQWDTLLLECGFLAIFLVAGPNRLLIFMFHWLLFRLRFMSGVSKLASGDLAWSNLDALKTYFETQPLTHTGAWYANQLPDWVLTGGCAFTLFTELIVPFFMFLPRRYRLFAAGITLFMQLLIIATSNHNFVNLLTIALCLFLLDDRFFKQIFPWIKARTAPKTQPVILRRTGQLVLAIVSPLIIISSLAMFAGSAFQARAPQLVREITRQTTAFGLGMDYHIFPTMQTQLQILEVQGSNDEQNWQSYTFRYTPGPLDRRPPFIVPHQPRLDWMVWFVPSQAYWNDQWFNGFLRAIQQGSPAVLDLLATNPFPDKPPRYARVLAWEYEFTNFNERKTTGDWWKRKYLGVFPDVPARYP